MKKFFGEFKTFISRGNVVDLAVGMIIGAAFTAIVNSLVNDLVKPVISLLTGGLDFSTLFVALDGGTYTTLAEAQEAGAAVFAFGNFILAIINFLITAIVIFLLVKGINAIKEKAAKKEEVEEAPAADPEPSAEEKLLAEIRDLLKNQEK